jgi:hypothetical protein
MPKNSPMNFTILPAIPVSENWHCTKFGGISWTQKPLSINTIFDSISKPLINSHTRTGTGMHRKCSRPDNPAGFDWPDTGNGYRKKWISDEFCSLIPITGTSISLPVGSVKNGDLLYCPYLWYLDFILTTSVSFASLQTPLKNCKHDCENKCLLTACLFWERVRLRSARVPGGEAYGWPATATGMF